MTPRLLALCLLCVLARTHGAAVKAHQPRIFQTTDDISVAIESMTSENTWLPRWYYSLPFCQPSGGAALRPSADPGNALSGRYSFNSPYTFSVNEPVLAKSACPTGTPGPLTNTQAEAFKKAIKDGYRVQMSLEGMPVTTLDLVAGPTDIKPGFELGVAPEKPRSGPYYIFNHLVFNVLIHRTDSNAAAQQSHRRSAVAQFGHRVLAWLQRQMAPDALAEGRSALANTDQSSTEDGAAVLSQPKLSGAEYRDPLSADNLAAARDQSPLLLVNFDTPWCPFCQRLLPVWDNVTDWVLEAYPEGPIRTARVNCQAEEATCTDEQVTAYPSIRVYRDGQSRKTVKDTGYGTRYSAEAYRGKRTVAAFQQYIKDLVADFERASAKATTHAQHHAGAVVTSAFGKGHRDKRSSEAWEVVGFEVMPCSIKRNASEPIHHIRCMPWPSDDNPEPQAVKEGEAIVFSYDVYWQESTLVSGRSRWRWYLRTPSAPGQWISVAFGGLLTAALVSLAVLTHARVTRGQRADAPAWLRGPEGSSDEAGWQLLSGDVFRAPAGAGSLVVMVGTGTQLLCTLVSAVALMACGALSPAGPVPCLTAALCLYALSGLPAGYASALVHISTGNTNQGWRRACGRTALWFPWIAGCAHSMMQSAVAVLTADTDTTLIVPAAIYAVLGVAWLCVALPLTLLGGVLAIKYPLVVLPDTASKEARPVPPAQPRARPYVLGFAASFLPFCVLWLPLHFVLESLWGGFLFSSAGFLAAAVVFAALAAAALATVCTYIQLRGEDHRWWWQAFHRSGAVSLFVAAFAALFFSEMQRAGTESGPLSVLLYCVYMGTVAFGVYLAFGALGFLASLWWVRSAYAAQSRGLAAEPAAASRCGGSGAAREGR